MRASARLALKRSREQQRMLPAHPAPKALRRVSRHKSSAAPTTVQPAALPALHQPFVMYGLDNVAYVLHPTPLHPNRPSHLVPVPPCNPANSLHQSPPTSALPGEYDRGFLDGIRAASATAPSGPNLAKNRKKREARKRNRLRYSLSLGVN
ncbi:hypothetical protein QCA50_010770 [Cerrena zonata]|uniref:Uncharacterized protein n=1 Tax=Cerrena zonata TaxID=2478898 RepID=A0AAW0GA83_9APHY